jgi:hypothetical protein
MPALPFSSTERVALRLLQEAEGRPRFIDKEAFKRLGSCKFAELVDTDTALRTGRGRSYVYCRITPAGRAYEILP